MLPDPESDRMLVTDGATGHVLAAGLDGEVRVFSDVEGHEVLTGIARGPDGAAYVTSFSQLPHIEGDGSVLRLHPDGSFDVAANDLTAPIDLAFDSLGRLYVLEFIGDGDVSHPYRGKTGRLVRLEPQGDQWNDQQVLVDGIPFPTALLIDNTDRVYVSVHGAFSTSGSGFIAQFDDLATRTVGTSPIPFS
jgi:streptogramin lyase